MARLLLVEDDGPLREALRELFQREGYETVPAENARQAERLLDGGIHLVVLDVGLPDGDGVRLCGQWRARGIACPILFLTAKDEEFDIVRGLDAGGNDYVTKPFRVQELLSRVRALLRSVPAEDRAVYRGGIRLDPDRMQASRDGTALNLTLTEYKILQMLLARRGIVTRAALLDALWDADARFVDDNTLSVHVSRLREKVGGERIKTVRGVGYQWQD